MPERAAGTTSVTIGGEQIHLTTAAREDGSLGEVIIQRSPIGPDAVWSAVTVSRTMCPVVQPGVHGATMTPPGRVCSTYAYGTVATPQVTCTRS